MANEAQLVSVKDRKGKFTGNYRCVLCDMEFRPDPAKPASMHQEFQTHLQQAHPSRKKTREDVNQAAARIVREATERD